MKRAALLALLIAALVGTTLMADPPGRGNGRGRGGNVFFLDQWGPGQGLPPGLAKRGGNLPPGLERHVERSGQLPPGLEKKRGARCVVVHRRPRSRDRS